MSAMLFWGSFREGFFHHNWNSMENLNKCNLIVGYHNATKFCTCHDSTAVMSCVKCHSNHCIIAWMRTEWNFHLILQWKNRLWNGPLASLTHWGRVTHICVNKLTIIGSDDGLSPDQHQAIIWTNAGILLIGPLGTNFSEILIEILTFSFKKMRLKVSSVKRRPFCLGLNVLY